MTRTVIPGENIGLFQSFEPSKGSFLHNEQIYASLAGLVEVSEFGNTSKKQVSVSSPIDLRHCQIPRIGDIIFGRIIRTDSKKAYLHIECLVASDSDNQLQNMVPTKEPFPAVIRLEDVRATEKDKIVMRDCFQPGDIVRAKIHSFGDSYSYLLTTADNDFGVVYALSRTSKLPLVPQSWQTMICPKTGIIEKRKCAKR